MTLSLAELAWDGAGLDHAFAALAERLGCAAPVPPASTEGALEARAACFGIEAVPVTAGLDEAPRVLAGLGVGVIAVDHGFLVVLRSSRRRLALLAPRGGVVTVPTRRVLDAKRRVDARLEATVDELVGSLGLPDRRRRRLREVLLGRHVQERALDRVWILRPPATASIRVLLREQHAFGRLWLFLVASAVQLVALASSWRFMGEASLASWGTADALVPWILCIATMSVGGVVAMWTAGSLAVDLGALLKRRLLAGALSLRADVIRLDGAGHFMAMAIEGEAVETAALAGGFGVLLGVLGLVAAAVVLGLAVGLGAVACLLLWVLVLGSVIAVYYRRRRRWARLRRDRSNELVERMAGQRTLVTQIDLDRWEAEEDRQTARYLRSSARVDAADVVLQALATRGWPLVGGVLLLAALAGEPSASRLAAAVGGILLAGGGFHLLVQGLAALTSATISIELLRPLLLAASDAGRALAAAPHAPRSPDGEPHPPVLLRARDLRFAYGRGPPVLDGCDLEVAAGERILIEGASGSGKSTLGAILAALRAPQGGELRLLDQRPEAIGERAWRQQVVAVPQFHDNHVFASTYAFNVLMGRDWPPGSTNVGLTTMISKELGLMPLLLRMPAGVQQQVGETGWQLSHGERSRLFIARALAQDAKVLILDESLAAIDPITVRRILEALDRRDVALVLIAHP